MPIASRGRMAILPFAVLLVASCGDSTKPSSADAASSSSNVTVQGAVTDRGPSRILPKTEFRSRVVRPEGLTLKPTEQQSEVVRAIDAAYAAVPAKDRREVNMVLTCQSMVSGSMLPFTQKAAAIAAAFEKVRTLPSAGTDCMRSIRR